MAFNNLVCLAALPRRAHTQPRVPSPPPSACNMAGADLGSCDLPGSELQGANLRGTNTLHATFNKMASALHMSQMT